MSWPHRLPLDRACIVDVRGQYHFDLVFDDVACSVLTLCGELELHNGEQIDLYKPPFPDWVRDLLQALVGVRIASARYRRNSVLRFVFEDGRQLIVQNGPYENWQYKNDTGVLMYGGVGQIS